MAFELELSRQELYSEDGAARRVLDSAVDAAALLDRELNFIYVTPGFTELTGRTNAELCGKKAEKSLIEELDAMAAVIRTGAAQRGVPTLLGGQRLMVNIQPVRSGGELVGVALLVLFRSMVALKKAVASFDKYLIAGDDLYDKLSRSSTDYTFSDYIGDSPNVLTTIENCHRIARTTQPVLLVGETGVGKEIIANGIFAEYSGGMKMPFIKINCAAIPKDLLESELFGHEKGAFTGASGTKKGKFEMAGGGVIMLDEIGEMDYGLQAKLLRVIESREFERIGGNKVIPLTARIIASTNQNLKEMAASGKFRLDLYYRLNIFEINLPPLRAHKGDIPKLIEHFKRLDGLELTFSDDALNMLIYYDWPGNVRELRNVLNRLHFLYPDMVIGVSQVYNATGEMFSLVKLPEYRGIDDPLPPPTKERKTFAIEDGVLVDTTAVIANEQKRPAALESEEPLSLKDGERLLIKRALESCGSNMSKAAAMLGVSRSTLYEKLKKHDLSPDKGK